MRTSKKKSGAHPQQINKAESDNSTQSNPAEDNPAEDNPAEDNPAEEGTAEEGSMNFVGAAITINLFEQLCRQFVDSSYYQKAISNPNYIREEAIQDFLIRFSESNPEQLSSQQLLLAMEKGLIVEIRKNYPRYF